MLERCYSPKFQLTRPTYKYCYVYRDWHTFSNFRNWMETQDWVGKQLDKDLLNKGNKVYSPKTCIFVSNRVNNLLGLKATRNSPYKLGVVKGTSGKPYLAYCNDGFKLAYLGGFQTEDEAHLAYLKFKKLVIINCANEQTDLKLKQALLNIADSYKLEI